MKASYTREGSSVRESVRLKTHKTRHLKTVSLLSLKHRFRHLIVGGSNPSPPTISKEVLPRDPQETEGVPSIITPILAEDLGIQLGDGSVQINTYEDYRTDDFIVSCAGHKKEDRPYIKEVVLNIKKYLYDVNIKTRVNVGAGTFMLEIFSKRLVKFYEKLGLPIGKKEELSVPRAVYKDDDFLKAFLRGLADTDGSLMFKRKYKDRHYYPVLKISNSCREFILEISKILDDFGISNYTHLGESYLDRRTDKTYTKHNLYLNGSKRVKKWMEEISFNNPKHLTKYLVWKKFEFCPPRTTLEERIKILEDKKDPKKYY